jgi:hypothetical protein
MRIFGGSSFPERAITAEIGIGLFTEFHEGIIEDEQRFERFIRKGREAHLEGDGWGQGSIGAVGWYTLLEWHSGVALRFPPHSILQNSLSPTFSCVGVQCNSGATPRGR